MPGLPNGNIIHCYLIRRKGWIGVVHG
jgi:hypothetical protein